MPQRDSIATFATDYGVNQNALWKVVRSTLGLFKEGVRCQMASSTLQDVLSGAGVRDEKAELVAGKYQEQLGALTAAMIDKTLVVNKLVDMEWKFGGEFLFFCFCCFCFCCFLLLLLAFNMLHLPPAPPPQ